MRSAVRRANAARSCTAAELMHALPCERTESHRLPILRAAAPQGMPSELVQLRGNVTRVLTQLLNAFETRRLANGA